MQLGHPEPVGVEDHHHRRVGHVDADFDDGGGHQDIQIARGESPHHLVLGLNRQAPVQDADLQRSQVRAQTSAPVLDGGHRYGARVFEVARTSPESSAESPAAIRGHTTYT